MIIAAHITQQYAFLHVELVTTSEPAYIEVEYDSSPEEDTVSLNTVRPLFNYSNGRSTFDVLVLTEKPFVIRTDDDEKPFEHDSEAYELDLEVGIDSYGWWIDPHQYLILDKADVKARLPMGRNIRAETDDNYGYSILFYHQELNSTRIYLRNMPEYSSIEMYLEEPILFSLEGVVTINLDQYKDEEYTTGSTGTMYGLYTGDSNG